MPEDRARKEGLASRLAAMLSARRGLRRITVSSLPAALAIGGGVPILCYGPADFKFTFGPPHMIPLAGDWNGDGRDGVGYYNPQTGIFNLRNTLRHGPPAISFRFGRPHMIPVAGNWRGLGRHDGVGFYNPWSGTFHLRNQASKGSANAIVRFGPPHMIPLAGVWFGV